MQQQPPLEQIDKYKVLSVLGKGAMGIVYHAFDPVVKRDVAIKFLSSIDSEETELISRFEREARLAGSLRHPNIVTIYDLGHFQGRPYIVMEYIVGRDLENIIRQKQPLSDEQKIEILLQICKGLDAAHQKGIIHRDIKPANVRIQEDNMVRIMDFGIARMGTSQLTRSGYIIGTLQYMSPEQVQGEALDPRTDVFSAGVIGYELFTGTNPFSGDHTVDIMYRILNTKPQPIGNMPEQYGTELNAILMRALEKNRELRYPNAREMAQDLEEQVFYLKSLKFRPKVTSRERVTGYGEGATQNIPLDQLPTPPSRDSEIPPTVVSPAIHPPMPTFGLPQMEKAPRTGMGANFSETAQVLLQQRREQGSKKFLILGGLMAMMLFAGLIFYPQIRALINPSNAAILPVNSEPPAAEVLMDGKVVGKTPLQITEHKDMTLRFRSPGFKEKTIPVSVDAWPAVINVKLEPEQTTNVTNPIIPNQPRKIKIQSTPAGAIVLIDGKEAGTTPYEMTVQEKESHKISLRLEGYQPVEQHIDVTSPETVSLELETAAVPGYVAYQGSYPAMLIINGKAMRGSRIELPPGRYNVTLRNGRGSSAYIRASREVEVISGQTTSIPQPAMGNVRLKANPSNCKISINGEFIDHSPVSLAISAGTHTITYNWDKLGQRTSRTIRIEPGQTYSETAVPD